MLTDLTIHQFKCFRSLNLSLAPLTLLTGYNGGGKSTLIQPLLLLSQALRQSSNPIELPLNGSLVRLGTIGDIALAGGGATTVTIGDRGGRITWRFLVKSGGRSLNFAEAEANGFLSEKIKWDRTIWPRRSEGCLSMLENSNELRTALSTISYLTAIRQGTPDVFPFPQTDQRISGDVGSEGEFAAYWYDRMVDEPVPNGRAHSNDGAATLRKEVDVKLSLLFPNAQANVTAIPQASSFALRFRIGSSSEWRRPANIGFGFSYAFPIVVGLLTIPAGQIFIIDSPEAHLHPFAQSEMGRMLALAASTGVQIIAETHSDHLLNGIRLGVKEGLIGHNSVAIHYFGGPTHEAHGVVSPTIDSAGNISDWPTGFFDQAERDLSRLSNWA